MKKANKSKNQSGENLDKDKAGGDTKKSQGDAEKSKSKKKGKQYSFR